MIGTAPTDRSMLSTGEVARLVGSSRQHVVDLCSRGELPYVWVGRHRRVPRSAVSGLLDSDADTLTRDQERSLWLHRALLADLMADPEGVLARGRQTATRLLEQHPAGMTARWLTDWMRILDRGVDEVAETLSSRDPVAVELRQNSPFAGVLSQETRARVLGAFAEHWRTDHGGDHARRPRRASKMTRRRADA